MLVLFFFFFWRRGLVCPFRLAVACVKLGRWGRRGVVASEWYRGVVGLLSCSASVGVGERLVCRVVVRVGAMRGARRLAVAASAGRAAGWRVADGLVAVRRRRRAGECGVAGRGDLDGERRRWWCFSWADGCQRRGGRRGQGGGGGRGEATAAAAAAARRAARRGASGGDAAAAIVWGRRSLNRVAATAVSKMADPSNFSPRSTSASRFGRPFSEQLCLVPQADQPADERVELAAPPGRLGIDAMEPVAVFERRLLGLPRRPCCARPGRARPARPGSTPRPSRNWPTTPRCDRPSWPSAPAGRARHRSALLLGQEPVSQRTSDGWRVHLIDVERMRREEGVGRLLARSRRRPTIGKSRIDRACEISCTGPKKTPILFSRRRVAVGRPSDGRPRPADHQRQLPGRPLETAGGFRLDLPQSPFMIPIFPISPIPTRLLRRADPEIGKAPGEVPAADQARPAAAPQAGPDRAATAG